MRLDPRAALFWVGTLQVLIKLTPPHFIRGLEAGSTEGRVTEGLSGLQQWDVPAVIWVICLNAMIRKVREPVAEVIHAERNTVSA